MKFEPVVTRKRGGTAATLHDVAKLASVSTITVSRAINDPKRVSSDTLSKVMEAVQRTGYVPNLLAGGLRNSKSRLVAALVPSLTGGVYAAMIQSLTRAVNERGYQLLLGQAGFGESESGDLLDAIIGRRPDGIVLMGVMHSPEGRRRLHACGIPVVETWELTPTPIDMIVGFSHERLGADVCDFLYKKGRRRIGLISGNDSRASQRNGGFIAAAIRAGIEVPVVVAEESPTSHEKGRHGFSRVIEQAPNVDAIFCGSDVLALGALTEARVRGISIPGDISLIGLGDVDFASSLQPRLTTVRVDYDGIGRAAAQFIIDSVEGHPVPKRSIDIGYSIVERDTA